ncbi:2,5-diketo-D-gluconic acid reductase B [Rhodobacteraceae bacterium THAF1]|uniref:aldo/keto reductase n=1 Tax=Palleronia sp. THAF1 TaxID=2587842 RepID=UPI000F3BDDC9|nr:aldo/keto reductase [Palleronia sp. THAF1]QFU09027.1 2,5-diketo-D-gluconic acid reductase B [Palleronia sp. THAF1]VDC24215.1 2,5-diketo-D-gluconic acid reductase B [Rhodobacteraceae bacterium THAF1]
MSIQHIGPAKIPNLGLGTFEMDDGKTTDLVERALAEGYRHIDTAQAYGNEEGVGKGIKASGVPRDEIFLTTKILPGKHDAEAFRIAAEDSLTKLGTDYVDLLLLHWPDKNVPLTETLPVLDALIDEGKVRFGGVSNFTIALLEEATSVMSHPIAANQIEFHPFIDQRNLLAAMDAMNIPFEAYSPLARGNVLGNQVLQEIAADHDANEAQISTAWILAKGGIAIPKTSTPERLAPNLAAAEITLSKAEIERIDALRRPDGRMISPDSMAPDWDD